MLPRFKYFLTFSELFSDSVNLIFSDMKNRDLVTDFETDLASYFNRQHCVTTSSYRMGVYYYLKSLNLPSGSEVLLTPITIPDVVNVILLLGLKPVFVDMSLENQSILIDDLKSKLNDKSKVLILTYLSGIISKEPEILELKQKYKFHIIEDISQAYGSKTSDGEDPFLGDIQVGSLSSGKVISTYTGGFVLTNNPSLDSTLRVLMSEAVAPPKKRFIFELVSNLKILTATSKLVFPFVYMLFWFMWRFNRGFLESITKSKMYSRSEAHDIFFDDFPIRRTEIPSGWKTHLCSWQAAIGLRFLRKIDKNTKKRQELGKYFYAKVNRFVRNRLPREVLSTYFNFYHVPFYIEDDKITELRNLFDKGIDSEGYGLNLCNEEEVFSDLHCHLPNAYRIKHECVFLPLHESYSLGSIEKMARGLNTQYNKEEEPSYVE